VQSRLVGYEASQCSHAIILMSYSPTFKPLRPTAVELAFDLDLVDSLCHFVTPAVSAVSISRIPANQGPCNQPKGRLGGGERGGLHSEMIVCNALWNKTLGDCPKITR